MIFAASLVVTSLVLGACASNLPQARMIDGPVEGGVNAERQAYQRSPERGRASGERQASDDHHGGNKRTSRGESEGVRIIRRDIPRDISRGVANSGRSHSEHSYSEREGDSRRTSTPEQPHRAQLEAPEDGSSRTESESSWVGLSREDRVENEEYENLRQPQITRLEREPRKVSSAAQGFVLPYPVTTENVISTFGDCRPGGRTHMGLDLAGVGDNKGLGTPVYSMSRAEVVSIGRSVEHPDKFGRPDKRRGKTKRGPKDTKLPRSETVGEYGPVYYFTRSPGSWRSGTIISTKVLEGSLEGHVIRYMHLGAVHPELERGSIVEAGQEIALMGGTAVQHDSPHVHIDIEDEDGQRVDVAPFLGLPADPTRCR